MCGYDRKRIFLTLMRFKLMKASVPYKIAYGTLVVISNATQLNSAIVTNAYKTNDT